MLEVRWKQRFENFENAFNKLKMVIEVYKKDNNNEIYQMAMIQAFEFTYELGWKTMKDFLKHEGIKVNMPRETIKQAFTNEIIEDGQVWIDMLEDRNLMSHTYSEENAKTAIDHIVNNYVPSIEQVHSYFKERL